MGQDECQAAAFINSYISIYFPESLEDTCKKWYLYIDRMIFLCYFKISTINLPMTCTHLLGIAPLGLHKTGIQSQHYHSYFLFHIDFCVVFAFYHGNHKHSFSKILTWLKGIERYLILRLWTTSACLGRVAVFLLNIVNISGHVQELTAVPHGVLAHSLRNMVTMPTFKHLARIWKQQMMIGMAGIMSFKAQENDLWRSSDKRRQTPLW